MTRDPGGLARPVAEPESRPPLGGNRGRGGRRAVAGPPHACAVATPAGDDSSLRQDRAAEVRAVSEALRGVLKHLVGPASPAVVLSARPVDRRDAQVNPLAGCGGGLRGAGAARRVRVHGVCGRPAGCRGGSRGAGAARRVWGLQGPSRERPAPWRERVLTAFLHRCDSEIPPALVENHHGFGGEAPVQGTGPHISMGWKEEAVVPN